jgi:hypothetical protein
MAALKPAPPAPTTTASYVWSTIVYDAVLEALPLVLPLPLMEDRVWGVRL